MGMVRPTTSPDCGSMVASIPSRASTANVNVPTKVASVTCEWRSSRKVRSARCEYLSLASCRTTVTIVRTSAVSVAIAVAVTDSNTRAVSTVPTYLGARAAVEEMTVVSSTSTRMPTTNAMPAPVAGATHSFPRRYHCCWDGSSKGRLRTWIAPSPDAIESAGALHGGPSGSADEPER